MWTIFGIIGVILDVHIGRGADSTNNHIMVLGNWNGEGILCLPDTSLKESSMVGILIFFHEL